MPDDYTINLENVIKQMLRPIKDIPFKLVIESITGHKIIPFDNNDKNDKQLLKKLIEVAEKTGQNINRKGIKSKRINEVGNKIEDYVKHSLNRINYIADTPETKEGIRQSTGYPDLEFIDEFKRLNYLECKTYNINSIDSTMRSFYLSPSQNFKVATDAHHFALSFEIVKMAENLYKCNNYKILTLDGLNVDVKYEFNSNNKRLYDKSLILAEGSIEI